MSQTAYFTSSGRSKKAPETIVFALPSSSYLDPKIWNAEKAQIFFRTWQCVGHVSELKKAGDYLVDKNIDQEIFIVRGQDQIIRGFYNVCMHRAHRLLNERYGCKSVITCPYHAWSYGLDGTLRGVPGGNLPSHVDKSSIRLAQVRVEIFCGLIFVNLDNDAPPLTPQVAHIEDDIRSFIPRMEDLRFVSEIPIQHESNWKLSIENYNECYHCPTVHAKSLAKGVLDLGPYTIRPEGLVIVHYTRAQSKNPKQYNYQEGHGARGAEFGAWFIWPNLAITCYPGGYGSIRKWIPLDASHTVYLYRWFSDGQLSDDEIKKLMHTHATTTAAEDAEVMKNVQIGLHSRGYRPGPMLIDANCSGLAEQGVLHIHKLWREALNITG
jgi:phenylpropionate dioxygenase-like ring-hydroxylating dioxygenase large terminal subunit